MPSKTIVITSIIQVGRKELKNYLQQTGRLTLAERERESAREKERERDDDDGGGGGGHVLSS